MRNFASEFQTVSRLYLELGDELAGIQSEDSNNSRTYLESILRKRDCLAKLEQTNSRALQLSSEWKECRSKLSTKAQNEIEVTAKELRVSAIRLNQLCVTHAQKIQSARTELAKSRAELGKGSRYLKSIKPVKNNYPKFIDSLY
jgi:hypothetical protein